MFVDGREIADGSTVDVDLCIVGAGPVGIALAHRFVNRSNVTVALLETGGMEFTPEGEELARAEAEGQPYYPIHETRIRMFGGSTISWGGVIAPLDPIDFEKRSWVPNSGWPFDRSELDPYYPETFRLCDVDPSTAHSSVEELPDDGRDWRPTPSTAWAPIYFSPPTRFGKRYAPEISASRNLTAYLFSTATKVSLHADGAHAEGIEVQTIGGTSYTVRAGVYVLAGGGIENARLLMTSRDVRPTGIGNDHDLLGRFFQEHPRVFNRFHLPEDTSGLAEWVSGAAGTLRFSRLGLSEEVQRREELLNFVVNLSFGFSGQETPQFEAVRRIANAARSPWSDSPYYQDTGGGPNHVRGEDVRTVLKRPDRTLRSVIGAVFQPAGMRRWLQVGCSVEQVPSAENRLVLTDELDRFGIPKVKLLWSISELEERTYRRGMELVLEALERYAPGIASQRYDEPDPWPEKILGTWHHIGTTRMDDDPSRGVVDADGKVHGVDNLYVTGSSVFPASGAMAPTLTALALALRMADHIDAQLAYRASGVTNVEGSDSPTMGDR